MASQSNINNPRVHLNKLLSRLSPKPPGEWAPTSIQWAVPGPSLDLFPTTAYTASTMEPTNPPNLVTTQLSQIQADEPLHVTTTRPDLPLTTPCPDWTSQLSGLRVAAGISLSLSILLALGLVYVLWLFYRLQHNPRDEETGTSTYYF